MPHLRFGDTVETRQYTTSEPPNSYDHERNTERHEEPSFDWQRRWQIHKLNKYNRQNTAKKDYPQWYLDNPTAYNTPKRPLPESTSLKPTSTTLTSTATHTTTLNCMTRRP